LRSVWEEFVDALRDAAEFVDAGAAKEHEEESRKYASNSYQRLEKPVLKRNESFQALANDLTDLVLHKSPPNSRGNSRGNSTHGISRISSKGMLLGIGCSSREPSMRGGNEWSKIKCAEMSPEALASKLMNETQQKSGA